MEKWASTLGGIISVNVLRDRTKRSVLDCSEHVAATPRTFRLRGQVTIGAEQVSVRWNFRIEFPILQCPLALRTLKSMKIFAASPRSIKHRCVYRGCLMRGTNRWTSGVFCACRLPDVLHPTVPLTTRMTAPRAMFLMPIRSFTFVLCRLVATLDQARRPLLRAELSVKSACSAHC